MPEYAMRLQPFVCLPLMLLAAGTACAEDSETRNAHFQSTYVWQDKPSFQGGYGGANSLRTSAESSYTFTATAAFGARLWDGGEAYADAEAAQGKPLSGLTGLAGFTNGEMSRTSGAGLKLYRARLFMRQTWGLGGKREAVGSAANQLAGGVDHNRLVLTVGNLSVLDIFDNNLYNHDPRTQFLNWALMTHGAYDYAADARGYSRGMALEWYQGVWAVRSGRFIQPKQPNQLTLDNHAFGRFGDQLEIEHSHQAGDLPGKVRVLFFRNRTVMSRFNDAIDAAPPGTPPDINNVRNSAHVKHGWGLNVEQALSASLGAFARYSAADGETETYAFTEIDRSLSTGLLAQGGPWSRERDTVGLALAESRLNAPRRDYLENGGTSFFIGDGQLNYRPERILEAFYSAHVVANAFASLDWQHIRNPAYNADRGPVNFYAVRMHAEF